MAKPAVILTGDLELDAKLVGMANKAVRKLLPKAARAAAKSSQQVYRQRVPVESGVMRDATKIRVHRHKHKAGTGKFRTSKKGYRFEVKRIVAEDIGARLFIDRQTIIKKSQRKRGGKALKADSRRRGKIFFYPSMVELGGRKHNGRRPLTKSLYNNQASIRHEFAAAMRKLVGL